MSKRTHSRAAVMNFDFNDMNKIRPFGVHSVVHFDGRSVVELLGQACPTFVEPEAWPLRVQTSTLWTFCAERAGTDGLQRQKDMHCRGAQGTAATSWILLEPAVQEIAWPEQFHWEPSPRAA